MAKKASLIAQRRESARTHRAPDYLAKRAELLRVAADVFREKGLAKATLNDVAAKLGADRATLYYYVGSKEELYQECITETVVLNLERIEETMALDLPTAEKLQRMIGILIDSQVEHFPYMQIYIQEDMAHASADEAEWAKGMVERTHKLEGRFIEVLKAGMADGSFRSDLSVTLVANSIFGMTQWTHRWWVPGESRYESADLIKTFSAVLLEGIANGD